MDITLTLEDGRRLSPVPLLRWGPQIARGPEMVRELQQLWRDEQGISEWRDVPKAGY
jgi:hypothetical protein